MKDPREYASWLDWLRDRPLDSEAQYAEICALLDAKDDKIIALKDALEELMAWQNGPPLENYRKPWARAMDNAERLLAADTAEKED